MVVPHNQRKNEGHEDKGNKPGRSAEHDVGKRGPCVPGAIAHGAKIGMQVQEGAGSALMSCLGLGKGKVST
jgi:hypothetical protein